MTFEFVISEEYASFAGMRIDAFLAQVMEGKTRSAVQKLIAEGKVDCGGRIAGKNDKLRLGDRIRVEVEPPRELQTEPEDLPLPILYEDQELLVVNKPKGMVVHPAAGNESGTMVNALLYHCRGRLSSINGVIRPGIVHRIDKDTSGLLLVAKTDLAHLSLAQQIKEHSCQRVYHTVVYGNMKQDEGTIETQIARHKTDRKRMAVVESGGKRAVTHYRVLERLEGFTYLECRLETGRTHQIRVHMAYLGHPVAGDPVYGPKKGIPSLKGQCLHAKEIAFTHPVTGERMSFDSELPPYFQLFLTKLRNRLPLDEPSFSDVLIASDCDGTLLCSDKALSEGNLTAIQRFQQAEGRFTIVTGRSLQTAAPLLERFSFNTPAILYNGAMIYDPRFGEILFSAPIPKAAKKAVEAVAKRFSRDQVGIELQTEETLYIVRENQLLSRHLAQSGVKAKQISLEKAVGIDWLKVLFTLPEELLAELAAFLAPFEQKGVSFAHSGECLYEMTSSQAGKANALARLCRMEGIDLGKTVAIGDYYNDLSLIRAAGYGVFTQNAPEELKKEADLVVSDNDHDAVAEVITYVMNHREDLF